MTQQASHSAPKGVKTMNAIPNRWKDEYNHYVNTASMAEYAVEPDEIMTYPEYLEAMLDYLMATSHEFVTNVVNALDTYTDSAEEHINKLHHALEEQGD
jgi:hypothetical protein